MTELKLEIEDEKADELRIIMAACGFEDFKNLIDNSLTIFGWIVRKVSEGREIAAIDEQTEKYITLRMKFMERIPRVNL